jgi:mannose-6-phosphate isomerase-like protein (cupin superfamily)
MVDHSHHSNKEYYFSEERCFITELFNTGADPAVSVARARVEPGVTTAWHSLMDTTERYLILAGVGMVEVGNSPPMQVRPDDVVVIAPMQRQRISNQGQEDLVFLAICSPRFKAENYHSLE